MRKRIIALVQLPPPIHGAAIMNAYATESLKSVYDVKAINLSSADTLADVGRLSLKKIASIVTLFLHIISSIYSFRPQYAYYALCPTGGAFYRDVIVVTILRLFRIKLIFHMHGQGISHSTLFKRLIYSYVFSNSDVIHLSECFWRELKPFIPRNSFHVIPNCVAAPLSSVSKVKSNPGGPTNFLYLSNYVRGKGVLYLLEAALRLSREKCNCRIVLAGDSYDLDLLDDMANWELENGSLIDSGFITIRGPVYGAEKDELLNAADVVVFPSYIDTFPLILLEAQAHKCAIVSTDVGAIPEILANGNAGIICSQRDAISLADAMAHLVNDPQKLAKVKSASYDRYTANYTPEIFSRTLLRTMAMIVSS